MPKRIKRERRLGWRMPEGAVYVGRPTKWGNPIRVGQRFALVQIGRDPTFIDRSLAVELFRKNCWATMTSQREFAALRGKDLVCWCPLDQPCHADVLLEWANAPEVLP